MFKLSNLFKEKMIGELIPYSKSTAKKNSKMVDLAFKTKLNELEKYSDDLNKEMEFVTIRFNNGHEGEYTLWTQDDYGDWCWNSQVKARLDVKKSFISLKIRPDKIKKMIVKNEKLQAEIDKTMKEIVQLKKERRYFDKYFGKYRNY